MTIETNLTCCQKHYNISKDNSTAYTCIGKKFFKPRDHNHILKEVVLCQCTCHNNSIEFNDANSNDNIEKEIKTMSTKTEKKESIMAIVIREYKSGSSLAKIVTEVNKKKPDSAMKLEGEANWYVRKAIREGKLKERPNLAKSNPKATTKVVKKTTTKKAVKKKTATKKKAKSKAKAKTAKKS